MQEADISLSSKLIFGRVGGVGGIMIKCSNKLVLLVSGFVKLYATLIKILVKSHFLPYSV